MVILARAIPKSPASSKSARAREITLSVDRRSGVPGEAGSISVPQSKRGKLANATKLRFATIQMTLTDTNGLPVGREFTSTPDLRINKRIP
jgi:hypothetical protein